ncbi:hypothetical protein KIW84_014816 [Lathyrus oleraceus]|uniref:Translation elongation factor EFG/EF2 domain-containing protein n=1 Tax=Pisum sativum TaxID=3888 RepID=A0A9D5GZJ8_PEA|nr:hypothetical protein KIW84_014816 [Pisum sativum]
MRSVLQKCLLLDETLPRPNATTKVPVSMEEWKELCTAEVSLTKWSCNDTMHTLAKQHDYQTCIKTTVSSQVAVKTNHPPSHNSSIVQTTPLAPALCHTNCNQIPCSQYTILPGQSLKYNWPCIVQPVSKDSGEQFSKALNRFQREDPTFRVGLDPGNGQTIIFGMGEPHLDIYDERSVREYKVDAVGKPRVNFRETVTQHADLDYLHKKQSGGRGQYGRVIGYIEPLLTESGTKFEFESMLVGQAVPSNFVPAIEKAANSCALIGHPVENLRVVLTDGAAHVIDSSELAFKMASVYAFRQCYTASRPVILEPVVKPGHMLFQRLNQCHMNQPPNAN